MLTKQVMLCGFVCITICLVTQSTFAIALRYGSCTSELLLKVSFIDVIKWIVGYFQFRQNSPNFFLQFTFGLQFTFSCNSLVHDLTLREKRNIQEPIPTIEARWNWIIKPPATKAPAPRVRFGRSVPKNKTGKYSAGAWRAPIIRFG